MMRRCRMTLVEGFQTIFPEGRVLYCGTHSAEHQAGECLDRWVHQEFFGNLAAADEACTALLSFASAALLGQPH